MASPDVFLSGYDGPVVIVTAWSGTRPSGCLVGFSTQCSIHPPRLLVCLSVVNHTYEVARTADTLGVHRLGRDQVPLASLFGEDTGDEVDKFAAIEWREGVAGTPMLAHCAAYLEGTVRKRIAFGDHDGFVLDVLDVGQGDGAGTLMLSDVAGFRAGHPANEVVAEGGRDGAGSER